MYKNQLNNCAWVFWPMGLSFRNTFSVRYIKVWQFFFNDNQYISYTLLHFHPNWYQNISYSSLTGRERTTQYQDQILLLQHTVLYPEHLFNKHSIIFEWNFNVHLLISCFNSFKYTINYCKVEIHHTFSLINMSLWYEYTWITLCYLCIASRKN